MTNNKMTIDAEKAVVGRLASFVAKQLLLGKEVNVINVDKAIIIGNPVNITKTYLSLRKKGGSAMKGPLFPSSPERIMKRIITGMLPHKKGRGEDAEKRVKCYEGIPAMFMNHKLVKSNRESVPIKSMTLKELSIR